MSRRYTSQDPRHRKLTRRVLGRNLNLSVASGAPLLDFRLSWREESLVLTATEKAGLGQDTTALPLLNNDVWTASLFVKVGNGRWTKLDGNLRSGEVLIQPGLEIVGGTKISLKLKKRGVSVVISSLEVPNKE